MLCFLPSLQSVLYRGVHLRPYKMHRILLRGKGVCIRLYVCILAKLGSTWYIPGDPLQEQKIPAHPFTAPILS